MFLIFGIFEQDSLGSDLVDFVSGSKCIFLSKLFSDVSHAGQGGKKIRGGSKMNGQETVGAQFKRQLASLMDTIATVCSLSCFVLLFLLSICQYSV
jgi:myosin heavy subunit